MRFEQVGDPTLAVIVCHGMSAWVSSPPLEMCSKAAPVDSPDCSLVLDAWRRLPMLLEGPELAGKCGTHPTLAPSDYVLIRGTSKPDPPISGQIKRTLCIDLCAQHATGGPISTFRLLARSDLQMR